MILNHATGFSGCESINDFCVINGWSFNFRKEREETVIRGVRNRQNASRLLSYLLMMANASSWKPRALTLRHCFESRKWLLISIPNPDCCLTVRSTCTRLVVEHNFIELYRLILVLKTVKNQYDNRTVLFAVLNLHMQNNNNKVSFITHVS